MLIFILTQVQGEATEDSENEKEVVLPEQVECSKDDSPANENGVENIAIKEKQKDLLEATQNGDANFSEEATAGMSQFDDFFGLNQEHHSPYRTENKLDVLSPANTNNNNNVDLLNGFDDFAALPSNNDVAVSNFVDPFDMFAAPQTQPSANSDPFDIFAAPPQMSNQPSAKDPFDLFS